MPTQPLITVVIPVYNRSSYLALTLESVISQSHSNFEILVVDDGSEEDMKPVIDDANDERISYYTLPHKNANVARNYGIGLSRGEYIAMLDGDDLWLPEHLRSCLDTITTSGTDGIYGSLVLRNADKEQVITVRLPFGSG